MVPVYHLGHEACGQSSTSSSNTVLLTTVEHDAECNVHSLLCTTGVQHLEELALRYMPQRGLR